MLSKDLTPNPKAVNIIRPSNNFTFISNPQQLNYSSSTDTISTASTNNTITLSPMIRQPSMESNPGLSFFCPPKKQQPQVQQLQQTSFEKIQSQPLVISRINLTPRRPTVTVMADLDIDDDYIPVQDKTEPSTPTVTEEVKSTTEDFTSTNNTVRLPSFKPAGFGIMSGTGLGSFMLRGNINQRIVQPAPPVVDEARVNRKIEDLEIEKKSLLTLNHTLETVVKEQSNTISDLQNRLASIERPLTPGLDISTSKNGIMSSVDILGSDDLERYLEDENAAYDRIRTMLLDLIEQAQSAVTEEAKVSGRVLTEIEADTNRNNIDIVGRRRGQTRPKSVAGDYSSSTRNLTVPNQKSLKASRRVSLGNVNSTTSSSSSSGSRVSSPTKLSSSPTASPIPNRRYSIQRSVPRPSSPAILKKSSSNSSMQSTTSRTSKNNTKHNNKLTQQDSQQTKKWSN